MRILLLTLSVLAIAINAFTQENIRTNIISYSDSTELIIRNGRKLIVDKTLAGEHRDALATLNYLKSNTDKRYVILYPVEELLLALANRSFPLFLYNARNFDNLLEGKSRVVFNQSIAIELDGYLLNELPFIVEELEQSALAEEDKQIIRLYIRYYTNENNEELNTSIKKYQKSYPDSDYFYFLNEIKKHTTTGRMNFVLGYGNEFLDGAIAETFTDRFHVMNMELEGIINKWYLSLFIGGSISRIEPAIDLPVKNKELTHGKDEKASSLRYGVKIGRTLFSNPAFLMYPFLTIGGYEMNSQASGIKSTDSKNPKNNLTGSFMAGFGIAGDIVLRRWESKSLYDPAGLFFIRPQVGYDRFISGKAHTNGSDFYVTVSLGISLGSL